MSLKKIAGADDLMTASDAARILGVSVDMVRIWAKSGELSCTSTIGGMRLFRRADVTAFARRRERQRSGTRLRRVK